MKNLGPIWAVAVTLDRDLALLVLFANLVFAIGFALLGFRGRRVADRLLITVGLFVVLTGVSAVGLHLFARTPVREVEVFAVE